MSTATHSREAKAAGLSHHGILGRARAFLAAAVLAILATAAVSDCAQMTSGDCAEKASCGDSNDGSGPSAGEASNGVDSPAVRDAAQGEGLDATSAEGGDRAVDDASVDATMDSPANDAPDATSDSRDAVVPGADADAADAPGLADGPPVTTTGDASPEGGPDAACPAPPAGWTAVLLEDVADGGACPTRWTAHDGFTQPRFGAGACTCSCSVTGAPNCNAGTLSPRMGGTSATCTQPWFSVAIQGTGCSPIAGGPITTLPANVATSPLPAQGGACTGSQQSDPSQLSASSARYCEATASGVSVCDPTGPGFSACIVSPGDVACPPGAFVNAHVVATQVSLACSACSACSVTGTCINAGFTTYRDSACTGNLIGFTANDSCSAIGLPFAPGTTIGAVAYGAALSQSSCTAGASTPSAELANAVTVCCP